ncbi:hypothetical protein OKJ48_15380 [Streptomyces kunmingensis]|uniref:Integral membrane protein n=1 Tax=Streptomyces kunmingensis TaxID=68225 RepID=A0ABU6CAE9_9ACTN|nr:hypothetical protein [Streptomyces kunmingensis]MEB3961618.1 hypothetical protein [Streptomyces kunmingensis]
MKHPSSDGSGAAPADPPPVTDALHLLAGAGVVAGGAGLVLALSGSGSPLRGPLALFFLLAAPGAAFAAALRGLDPWARGLVSAVGAIAVVMLVAQGMLATHRWSVDGGVITVGAVSALAFVLQWSFRFRARRKRMGKIR